MKAKQNLRSMSSSFYRGISLKDYMNRTAKKYADFAYPDQETIFVDQQSQPISTDDSLIFSQPQLAKSIGNPTKRRIEYSLDSKGLIYSKQVQSLPPIYAKKTISQIKPKNVHYLRLKTNVSIESLIEKRKEMIQQTKSTQDNSVSIKKKYFQSLVQKQKLFSKQKERHLEESVSQKMKNIINIENMHVTSQIKELQLPSHPPNRHHKKIISESSHLNKRIKNINLRLDLPNLLT